MWFNEKLKYRGLYAIHSGHEAGAFFVYIKEEDKGSSRAILIIPGNSDARYIPTSEIDFDLKHKNIKLVKKLPVDIYSVCRASFVYNAKKAGTYAG